MTRDTAPSASERLLRTLLPAVCTPSLSSGVYGRPVLPRLKPLDRPTATLFQRSSSSTSETVQSPPLCVQQAKRPRREVWDDDEEGERKRRPSASCRKPTYLARKVSEPPEKSENSVFTAALNR